jgi:uncharacterized Ntn-hydrolase superfamily protein
MTYSIVARDVDTGELGVAVQSHYFSTGSVVPWLEAGVGAVATQSMVEVSYGPLGLELLKAGRSPSEALRGLVAADPGEDRRQVAIVDATGRVAVHTGARCIAEAGHVSGDGFSVQANMMTNATVPDAMAAAFTAASGSLAERLLDALDAAEAEGGDIRGRQSAALVVVAGQPTPRPWERVIDVRVEDAVDPLRELRRLVALKRAYIGQAPATTLGEANPELVFWQGVTLATAGQVDEALPLLRQAYAVGPGWAELLRRLPASGLFPDDPELIERLTADAAADA